MAAVPGAKLKAQLGRAWGMHLAGPGPGILIAGQGQQARGCSGVSGDNTTNQQLMFNECFTGIISFNLYTITP